MEELNKDIAELISFRVQASRASVQQLLDREIKTVTSKIEGLKKASEPSASVSSKPTTAATTAATNLIPSVKLTNYALDQSDKFIKLYVPLKGIQSHDSSKITSTFEPRNFEVVVSELNGKNYTIAMKDLLEEIVPESCQVKQKSDDLLVMLRKKQEGKNWDVLTRVAFMEKEKNKPKLDDKIGAGGDPQASLMEMMKQMYDSGDDEMKRNIRKAYHEGQSKKGGMGMPGMDM